MWSLCVFRVCVDLCFVLALWLPGLLYWHQRYPIAAEDWWQCTDWLSYEQCHVSFIGDIQFEYLKAQIATQGAHTLSLAQTTYQNDPQKFIKFLSLFRLQHPIIATTPIYRSLVFSTIQHAKKKQDEDRRIMIQRMTRQRIPPARRQSLPAVPQQGRLWSQRGEHDAPVPPPSEDDAPDTIISSSWARLIALFSEAAIVFCSISLWLALAFVILLQVCKVFVSLSLANLRDRCIMHRAYDIVFRQ